MSFLIPWLATGAEGAAHARPASEAELVLPHFDQVRFLGMSGTLLLTIGLGVCVLGLLFGLMKYQKLKNLPVHKAMREISELIYATCKTYLRTQAKFIFQLWILIAIVIVVYFAALEKVPPLKVFQVTYRPGRPKKGAPRPGENGNESSGPTIPWTIKNQQRY